MDPSHITMTEDDYILAMTFNGMDIANTSDRYFDVVFTQKHKSYGVSTVTEYIDLIPCPR